MTTKKKYLSEIKTGSNMKIELMVNKIIAREASRVICILSDKTGDIKATIPNRKDDIKEGRVLESEGGKGGTGEVKKYAFIY